LIITGAHIEDADLKKAPFYEQLKAVIDWSYSHVTSTLCSCLATHAVLEFRYGQKRQAIGFN
jgi:homoserine O-succinyltransferase